MKKNIFIPKIIHFVWLGGKPKPDSVLACIESWKKFCPDWQIMEWNESNFNLNEIVFVKQALEAKKWAFASDVLRLLVLKKHGGVYMDTDYELYGPLDNFLNNSAFFSFENKYFLGTAIIGCTKDNPIIEDWLNYYYNREFLIKGKPDTTTNVDIISAILRKKYKTKLINGHHTFEHARLYPSDYFYPKNYFSGKTEITENSVGIHHYAGTWMSGTNQFAFARFARKVLGKHIFNKIINIINILHAKKMYRKINKKNIQKK